MSARLTDDQKDDRKWRAATVYLECWHNYRRALETYGPLNNETEAAWHTLLTARSQYRKVAKL